MGAEPKRRHSRQRKGKRRASISLSIPNGVLCSNCNKMILGHVVCKYCGYYRGNEIISKAKKETSITPAINE